MKEARVLHLVQKTKCADFNMKSAAVGRFFAHCNRKSLAAANTRSRFSASNTVLLTCVIGNPPCAHILPSHRFSLHWRPFVPADCSASAWPHAHSTVSCRHFCLLPCLSYSKERCGHGVYYGISIFSFTVNHRPQDTYGREGCTPFSITLCNLILFYLFFLFFAIPF